jgi:hypothetical protein
MKARIYWLCASLFRQHQIIFMGLRTFGHGEDRDAATWPLAARAQQAGQRLIGALIGPAQSDPAAQSWFAAFQDALAKLGWREGGNLRIELRWGAGDADRIGTLAKELVDMRPDAIFGATTPVIGALARETRTIRRVDQTIWRLLKLLKPNVFSARTHNSSGSRSPSRATSTIRFAMISRTRSGCPMS